MSDERKTIQLPNSGCIYLGTRYDKENDETVVEYIQLPGRHMQVLKDTGVYCPEGKVRREKINLMERSAMGDIGHKAPLDEIARSEDPLGAAKKYFDEASRGFLAGLVKDSKLKDEIVKSKDLYGAAKKYVDAEVARALETRLGQREQEENISNKQFRIGLTLRLDDLYGREENLSDGEKNELRILAGLEDRYIKLEDIVCAKEGKQPRPTPEQIKQWCGYLPEDWARETKDLEEYLKKEAERELSPEEQAELDAAVNKFKEKHPELRKEFFEALRKGRK